MQHFYFSSCCTTPSLDFGILYNHIEPFCSLLFGLSLIKHLFKNKNKLFLTFFKQKWSRAHFISNTCMTYCITKGPEGKTWILLKTKLSTEFTMVENLYKCQISNNEAKLNFCWSIAFLGFRIGFSQHDAIVFCMNLFLLLFPS